MNGWTNWINGLADKAHSSEWISGICGIGGAVFGSLVAIVLTESFNARRRTKDQREKFAAAAFAAYQRLNQIYTVAMIIRDHLKDGESISKEKKTPQCLATRPIQRMSPPVTFPMDELWAITKIGGKDTINAINSLDNVFNTLLDSMDMYAVRRQELNNLMPPPTSMQGDHGTAFLTETEAAKLQPIVADLNMRLEALTPMSHRLVEDCFRALVLIATEDSKLLGKEYAIQTKDPNGILVKFGALIKSPIPVDTPCP